jgi:hypothetical protein
MNRLLIIMAMFAGLMLKHPAHGATRTGKHDSWPVYEIHPIAGIKLKDIFDAGLRPYRFPSFEKTLLECKHFRARIVQFDGISLPEFPTELARIDIEAQSLIADIEFRNVPMTLSESKQEMLKWIRFGTRPVRTDVDLESFLAAVKLDYRGYNYGPNAIDHNFSINWEDKNGVVYGVWFQQARHPVTPLAIHMSISFPLTPLQAGTSYDIPIPPPPGYEHVDMTAPRDFGPDSLPEDPEIERVRKAGVMPDYSMLPKEKVRSGILPTRHVAGSSPSEQQIDATKSTPNSISSLSIWVLVSFAGIALIYIVKSLTKRR